MEHEITVEELLNIEVHNGVHDTFRDACVSSMNESTCFEYPTPENVIKHGETFLKNLDEAGYKIVKKQNHIPNGHERNYMLATKEFRKK